MERLSRLWSRTFFNSMRLLPFEPLWLLLLLSLVRLVLLLDLLLLPRRSRPRVHLINREYTVTRQGDSGIIRG